VGAHWRHLANTTERSVYVGDGDLLLLGRVAVLRT